ncbi:MAG: hypothetical protein EOO77_32735 [Oxalobacteraceae bacterium]|nr:MAG: hypothetical protein EOO77_32735 [Oxalobacteraceae bacterium]
MSLWAGSPRVYAAGTGSWFAYNLRSFNLAAYEARRIRAGLEAHPAGPSVRDLAAAGLTTVANVATDGAKAVGHGASATVDAVGHAVTFAKTGAAKGGGWLYGAASGYFRRNSTPSATENAAPGLRPEIDRAGDAEACKGRNLPLGCSGSGPNANCR